MMTAHGHLSHAGPEPVVTFDPGERDLHGATVGRDRTRAGVWARHPFVTEAGENDMKDAKGPFWIAVFVVLTVTLAAAAAAVVAAAMPSMAEAVPGSVRLAVRPAIQIAGPYHVFRQGGAQAYMNINNDATWDEQWVYGGGSTDTGYWLNRGTTLAQVVTSGQGDGCLFLGRVGRFGIGNQHKPGIYNCLSQEGEISTWFACNSRPGGCYNKAPGRIPEPVTTNAGVGTYDVVYDNGTSSTMTVNADGTWSQTATGPIPPDPIDIDTGYWVSLGSAVALSVYSNTNEEGCLFLGQVTKHGLDLKSKPGRYNCNNQFVGTWYATRSG